MFEEWMAQTNQYVQKHIDRRIFQAIAASLNADIEELCNLYVAVLLDRGVINQSGDDTGVEIDEDDLLEEILARFLAKRDVNDELALLYAALIDAYLALVQEASEDA